MLGRTTLIGAGFGSYRSFRSGCGETCVIPINFDPYSGTRTIILVRVVQIEGEERMLVSGILILMVRHIHIRG